MKHTQTFIGSLEICTRSFYAILVEIIIESKIQYF